jgi:hypothetical protein
MNQYETKQSKGLEIPIGGDTNEAYDPAKRHNIDFTKLRIGVKTIEDALLNEFGVTQQINSRYSSKKEIIQAIDKCNYDFLREVSNFYFRTNGIYSRLCKYMANLYCYDWMLTPYVNENGAKVNENEVLSKFYEALTLLDNFKVKAFFGKAALKVITQGVFYGYLIQRNPLHLVVLDLPANYCRSILSINGRPAVEFNMKYFDDKFSDTAYRLKILKTFPKDIQRGYVLYKENKLPKLHSGDKAGWYLLDPECAFMFNNSGEATPLFASVIPYLIDLENAQELDRKKMAQKLIKIIIQKMPIDKNGDLVFDTDEITELHNNAVRMLGNAIGIDVLTTFADVDVADLADKSNVNSLDELEKVERTVYNSSGTAQNLFNTDGNLSLEKSIANDEASIYNLILQFEDFLNFLIERFNKKPKKYKFGVQILKTTIYNYKELSKLFKENATTGSSKLLPLIALGQSQSSILANAYFETQVLDLVSLFIPPLTSNTMNSDALKTIKGGDSSDKKVEEKKPGRKEKADDEKSDKTIANRESMN